MNPTTKITVITDKAGRIVATAGHSTGEAGSGGPLAGPGEVSAEIDVSFAVEDIESPDELHRALEKQLRRAAGS